MRTSGEQADPAHKWLHRVYHPGILRPEGGTRAGRWELPLDHTDNEQFAEIALSLGFCTSDAIRRCLKIQGDTTENLSLGQSLLREGFLSGEQYSKVLKLLRSRLKKAATAPSAPAHLSKPETPTMPAVPTAEDREDDLLGKLAIREGWFTADDLRACLQGEKPGTPRRRLAEILVAKGYLTPARATELLARVSRRPMHCPRCAKTFTVLSIANSREVACPTCQGVLEDGQIPDRRPAKDPLATQTFRVVSDSLKGSRQNRHR